MVMNKSDSKSKMVMNKRERSDSRAAAAVSKKRKGSPALIKGRKSLFDVLPADIIKEILLRLSAADIVKIRLVCKQFCQLSWQPSFISEHTKRHNIDDSSCFILHIIRSPTLLTLRSISKLPALGKTKIMTVLDDYDARLTASQMKYYKGRKNLFIFPKTLGRYVAEVQAACQGLLCFSATDVSGDLSPRKKEEPFVIGNPLTGEWMSVIIPTQTLYTWVFGFYFHASSGKYKLLVMFEDFFREAPNFSLAYGIFELVSNTLRPIDSIPCNPATSRVGGHAPVLLHGNLHWLGYQGQTTMPTESRHILVFNMETEQFSQKQIPDGFIFNFDIKLFAFQGKLCLFKQIAWPEVFVWVLEDYENGVWIEKRAVIRSGLFDHRDIGEETYEFLLYTKTFQLLLVKPGSCDTELTFYHKKIADEGGLQTQYSISHATMLFGQKYNETIASVGMQKIMLRKPSYMC